MSKEQREQNSQIFHQLDKKNNLKGNLLTSSRGIESADKMGFYHTNQIALLKQKVFDDWNRHFHLIYIENKPLTAVLGKTSFESVEECIGFIKETLFGEVPQRLREQKFTEILPELNETGLMFAGASAVRDFHFKQVGSRRHAVLPLFVPTYHLRPTIEGFAVEETLKSSYYEQQNGTLSLLAQDAITLSQTALFEIDPLQTVKKTIQRQVTLSPNVGRKFATLYEQALKLVPENTMLTNVRGGLVKGVKRFFGGIAVSEFEYSAMRQLARDIKSLNEEIQRHMRAISNKKPRAYLSSEYGQSLTAIQLEVAKYQTALALFSKSIETHEKESRDQYSQSPYSSKEDQKYNALTTCLISKRQTLEQQKQTLIEDVEAMIAGYEKRYAEIETWPLRDTHQVNKRFLLGLIRDEIKTLRAEKVNIEKETKTTRLTEIDKQAIKLKEKVDSALDKPRHDFDNAAYQHEQLLIQLRKQQERLSRTLKELGDIKAVCQLGPELHTSVGIKRANLFVLNVAVNQLSALWTETQQPSNQTQEKFDEILKRKTEITKEVSKIISTGYYATFTESMPIYLSSTTGLSSKLEEALDLHERYQKAKNAFNLNREHFTQTIKTHFLDYEQNIDALKQDADGLSLNLSESAQKKVIDEAYQNLDQASLNFCKEQIEKVLNEYAKPSFLRVNNRHFLKEAEKLIKKIKAADSRHSIIDLIEKEKETFSGAKGYLESLENALKIVQKTSQIDFISPKAA